MHTYNMSPPWGTRGSTGFKVGYPYFGFRLSQRKKQRNMECAASSLQTLVKKKSLGASTRRFCPLGGKIKGQRYTSRVARATLSALWVDRRTSK